MGISMAISFLRFLPVIALALMQSVHATIFEPSDMAIRLHSSLVLLHLSHRLSPFMIRLLTATGFAGLVFISGIKSSTRIL